MLTIFLSGISPIPFGLGGLIFPANGFMGPGILAAANQKLETGTSNEELDEIYAALKEKYPDLAVNHSDVERTYSTDESITYAGKRKVLGGNGSGTPDGLAWVTIGTVNYFTEDIATIVSPDASLDERLLAAAFTFVKPLKYVDDGIEIGATAIKGLKAKDVGKVESKGDTGKKNLEIQFTKEQLATKPSYSPAPDKWTKKGGKVKIDEDGTWIYTNKKGQTVRYPDGYPDFTEYSHPTVKPVEIEIASPTNRPLDYKNANIKARLNKDSDPPVQVMNKPPTGYIWHHHQDGKTMILVQDKIHAEFTHAGGISNVNKK